MMNDRSNKELYSAVSETVIGHSLAKKALINLLSRSAIRYYQKWVSQEHEDYFITPSKVLLIGPSGTGKTLLVETLIQNLLDRPLVKIDATRLTLTGAGEGSGIKSADLINMIKAEAFEYSQKQHVKGVYCTSAMAMDKLVLFVDEIDKLAWGTHSEGDHWNKRIQSSFLQIFENRDDLAGVSIIFAGAFSELERQRSNKDTIGFNKIEQTLKEQVSEDLEELIVKYGLIPELVGRISTIVELDKFEREDYKRILVGTLIPRKIEELIYFNCSTFALSAAQIDGILDRAIASGQGVRYLKRELDKLTLDIEFNYEDEEDRHHLLLSNLLEDYKKEGNYEY